MQGNPTALEHLKALLAAREPDYARADATIDTSGRSIADCFADLETIAANAFQTA
jgi:XRE family transcriptional regulator, aerobic/anaerobic benzoate catabolism transcriptional regulator